MVIGILQVACSVQRVFFQKRIVAQHLPAQGNDGISDITAEIAQLPDMIDLMGHVAHTGVAVGLQHQHQIHYVAALHRVGTIVDKVFVETIIAPVGQIACDACTLSIQIVGRKQHTTAQTTTHHVVIGQEDGNS